MSVTRYLSSVHPAALAAIAAHPIVLELLTERDGDPEALAEMLEGEEPSAADTWGATRADVAAFLREPGVADLECLLEPYEDFDKSWAGIHFVLTGKDAMTQKEASGPLELALIGGRELAGTGSVVSPRIVAPDDVAAIAKELARIRRADFERRIDLAALERARIYPNIWDDRDEAIRYLVTYFEDLRGFYRDAAKHGAAVLVRTSV